MLPFRRILFPVDYSEPCLAVVPYVKEALRHFAASLTVVHAYGPEALAYSELPISDPDLAEDARAAEEQRLLEFVQVTFPGEQVERIVQLGEAGTIVHEVVQHQGADLVMLATHGRGPLRRFLLGSVAAKVLHDVGTPVWTGIGSALVDHAPALPYKRILCAVDQSEEAEAVLRAAAALACSYGAKLSLLHVVELPPPVPGLDVTPYWNDLLDAANNRLRELKTKLEVDAPQTVTGGYLPDVVREEAVRVAADLVITGRGHAQLGLGRIWSQLYSIVRQSPCPVLSI